MPRRPTTRQDQKAATRALLLRVGRRVFARHGFDATSVVMLCHAARVTHGALYHHFPGKLELFTAVAAELTAEVAARVQQAAAGADGWAQVEAACDAYLDACSDPVVGAILLRDAPRVIPPATLAAIDHGANEPMVTGLLQRWIDAGLMRPFPVAVVGRLLGAAFAEAGTAIALSEEPQTTRRQVGDVLRTWIEALRAEPPAPPDPRILTAAFLVEDSP